MSEAKREPFSSRENEDEYDEIEGLVGLHRVGERSARAEQQRDEETTFFMAGGQDHRDESAGTEQAGVKKHVLLMMPGSSSSADKNIHEIRLLQVPHPRQDVTIICADPVSTKDSSHFLELQSAQLGGKYGSWFINQRVVSSQSIYLATRMDPRFLLLPYLEQGGSRFSPIEQIIHSVDQQQQSSGRTAKIPLEKINAWKMEEMSDINDKLGDDMRLYRHNPGKVIEWLRNKVNKVADVLARQRVEKQQSLNKASTFVLGGVHPAESCESLKSAPTREEIKLAVEIVCDCVSESNASSLIDSFGFNTSEIGAKSQTLKRKSDWEIALEVSHHPISVFITAEFSLANIYMHLLLFSCVDVLYSSKSRKTRYCRRRPPVKWIKLLHRILSRHQPLQQ